MFKRVVSWLWPKAEVAPIPTEIIDRIDHFLGALNDETLARYKVRKSMSIKITMASADPIVLETWMTNVAKTVETNTYVDEAWKTTVRVRSESTLDDYLTYTQFTVPPDKWMTLNKPRIARLVKAFRSLEYDDDQDYYQRNYNSVLHDVDILLQGIHTACN